MTEEQLKQGQEIKRIIAIFESELEKFSSKNQAGLNVYLPNCDTLIEDVKQVFVGHLAMYNKKFKEL